jgi:hypothetical protein
MHTMHFYITARRFQNLSKLISLFDSHNKDQRFFWDH